MLFASLVDDPSAHPDRFPTKAAQQAERERLFAIIRELVKWDNVSGGEKATDPQIVEKAREEILRATAGNLPPVLDPFCGGGSIPLEAQRLGLEAHASDLNPVAVLITKALIEIPPKFAGRPPVHPRTRQGQLARTCTTGDVPPPALTWITHTPRWPAPLILGQQIATLKRVTQHPFAPEARTDAA